MKIRAIRPTDADLFYALQVALDEETKYMMYEPGEREKDLGRTKCMIETVLKEGNLLLVAEANAELVGYILAERGSFNRIRHTAYIVIGILSAFQGKGIGTTFFKRLEEWARESRVTRLELTVMCHNEVARHLYEKHGFEVEGIRKHAMIVDGQYVDEYYMGKLLE